MWALKDINFGVKQGEVVGIIGRNGASKSTLLKILNRTTSPATGCVKIKGRVAILLEVGTGFHPKFNVGENIFPNGAILGMTRQDVISKFDELPNFAKIFIENIVAFTTIQQPTKNRVLNLSTGVSL
ncbi:MAG: ATP-binding cassette domain-containing protein [Ferruginibacter sp.]